MSTSPKCDGPAISVSETRRILSTVYDSEEVMLTTFQIKIIFGYFKTES